MPEDDDDLQDYLRKYVGQNLKRSEILDFVKRDYPQYPCSLPTLDRRLRLFGVRYINYDTKLEVVKEAVQKELAGPGKLLGYRAMNLKLRTEHGVQVPRHLVASMQAHLDPDGVEERNKQKENKKGKGSFYIRRAVMGSLFRWPRQAVWIPELEISAWCLRISRYLFPKNAILVRVLL